MPWLAPWVRWQDGARPKPVCHGELSHRVTVMLPWAQRGGLGCFGIFFFFFCVAEKSFRNEETKTRNLGTSSGASHDDKLVWKGKSQPKSGQRKEQMGATGGL